ncbi:hypothetical protein T484DRAFT_1815196 [Baffinella frigidus]|nr:hypothetical protein T484DRAFT_1815196 [Cryptophyta sp. CCMP2293]
MPLRLLQVAAQLWLLLFVAAQLWLLLSFVCDSLAVAGQGLIADALGRGQTPSAAARWQARGPWQTDSSSWGSRSETASCESFYWAKRLCTVDATIALAVAPLLTY